MPSKTITTDIAEYEALLAEHGAVHMERDKQYAELLTEIVSLRQDRARLDWLSSNMFDCKSWLLNENKVNYHFHFKDGSFVEDTNLRQAISAAMKK